MNDEAVRHVIERQIERLENSIREAAKTARFGDPAFSEWYCIQTAEIGKLRKELKEK